jgi:hypothetical protein
MFGNHPLPNIAPSLLLFLPPPPDAFPHRCRRRPPRDRPHGLSEGVPIADADAHQPRHVTVAYRRHVTRFRRSPRPPHRCYRPSPRRGMWASDIQHIPHRQPQPLRATVERHVTHGQRQPPMPRHATKAPAVERHVTKNRGSEESRNGSRRGKEPGEGGGGRRRKRKPRVGRRAFVPPPSCSVVSEASETVCTHTPARSAFQTRTRRCASYTPARSTFQMPARRCASHTPSRTTFQTQTRRCASHIPSRLAFQMRTSGVHPTHRSVRAFLSPPIVWGGILPCNSKNEAA